MATQVDAASNSGVPWFDYMDLGKQLKKWCNRFSLEYLVSEERTKDGIDSQVVAYSDPNAIIA